MLLNGESVRFIGFVRRAIVLCATVGARSELTLNHIDMSNGRVPLGGTQLGVFIVNQPLLPDPACNPNGSLIPRSHCLDILDLPLNPSPLL